MSHDHHEHMNHGDMNHDTMNHGDVTSDPHAGHHNHGMPGMPDMPLMGDSTPASLFDNLTSVVPLENIGHSVHGDHMNHGGGMDMTKMNHSGGGGGHMDMKMYFHFGYDEKYVLFYFWTINSVGGLIGSMIGLFLLAMLYEGLKVLREYLFQRKAKHEESLLSQQNGGSSSSSSGLRVPLAGEDDPTQMSPNVVVVKTFFRPNPFSWSHVVQTVLHMIQLTISYLLMLIFMTYNVWLCMAVVLGAGAGYFTFSWRKRTIIDINEHCH